MGLNASVTRPFSVTNPGGEPSGRLSIGTNDARFGASADTCGALTVLRGESATVRSWTVTNEGDLPTGTLTTSGNDSEFGISSDGCAGASIAGGESCSQLVAFTPQANGPRSGTISVGDGSTNVILTLRGVGQALPAVGSPCLDGRCAGTATCENHSNGQSLVCCGQNCTGNQRWSENQGFESCKLPRAGQGQGCGNNVSCNPGLTCDPTTGTCCTSGCGGEHQHLRLSPAERRQPDAERRVRYFASGMAVGRRLVGRQRCRWLSAIGLRLGSRRHDAHSLLCERFCRHCVQLRLQVQADRRRASALLCNDLH